MEQWVLEILLAIGNIGVIVFAVSVLIHHFKVTIPRQRKQIKDLIDKYYEEKE